MIDELKAATQPGAIIWDRGEKSSVKGLHLRVARDGTKTFYLAYRTRDGRQRKPKIGELGVLTLSEARTRARAVLASTALGVDPKEKLDEIRAELTVGELFQLTWKECWAKDRYQESGWAQQVDWLWKNHLEKEFAASRMSEVTPARVRRWHAPYAETSVYNGNRALRVFSRMFRFAEEQELRAQKSNPCRLVKAHPEKKRGRYASPEEIGKIVKLLEENVKRFPAGVAFIYLLMYTGSRPRAIERATWDQLKEFDMDGQRYGLLTFAGKTTDKTGQAERVILPPQAMKALNRLPRVEGCTITGMKMPRTLWRKIKKEAGCPDLWARDWRRTFATVGMSGGVDMWTIGSVLNHRSTETTKIYAKVVEDRQLDAATSIANSIEKIAQAAETKA